MEKVTRHKSCVACIQTKRKCDRTQPRCQRCITRGSECQYIGRNRVHQQQQQQLTEQLALVANSGGGVHTFDVQHSSVAALFSSSANDYNFEFPHPPLDLPLDYPLLYPGNDGLIMQPHPPFGNADAKLYARVEYCASRLARLAQVFATTGQTMFIQRQTFMALSSLVLQQAMSACALYSMKRAATKALVHQILQHNVQHLLTTTNPRLCSNPELLAALQALLLYQLMRLFDGDIRLRVSAEADEETTILWASELRTRACALSLPLYPVATFSESPQDWHAWLFSESVRRTVVTTFLLRGVYNYLKTGTDSPTVVGVYFTVQSDLWDAQSEASWVHAKNEKLELQVMVSEWDAIMALASPDDLEELGVLVMSMLWGLKSTQEWLGHEKSVEHGLDAV